MKSTKVQNPRRKCSAVQVVETNCPVAEYRIPYRIGLRTIITHAHRAPLIDGLGHATGPRPMLRLYFSEYAHARAKVGGEGTSGLTCQVFVTRNVFHVYIN